MSFTHADVENIIKLLDASHFDELLLEADGVKLQLRRHGVGAGPQAGLPEASVVPQPSREPSPITADAGTVNPPKPAATPTSSEHAASTQSTGLLEIRAPMLGTFYCCPKPGAAPFVSVGSRVEPDTVVGIIEVMKLMNSTSAGVSGEIVEILVHDGELVEYDQPLIRVRA